MGIFYLFIYFVKVKVDWDRIDPMTRLRATNESFSPGKKNQKY